MRTLFAIAMCLWLAIAGGAVHALELLEDEHQHEHLAMGDATHDATDHRHADADVDLFSDLFAKVGFAHLGAGWIAAHGDAAAHSFAPVAAQQRCAAGASVTPVPPPGPPPRSIALHRGG